ncbi:hypothetical protein [Pararhizobium gei]|uniref:hypothetical protein n=1 Tax=Pararhizobium gei TaxID=1395951 RepID=UPI0023D9CF4A|nr:hypothetical protein [Rhizobium gei]
MLPEFVETTIIDGPDEVRAFLQTMNLSVNGVLAIRDIAYVHLTDTSPLMARNAAGTLAYHYGLGEMRVQFLGKHWEICVEGGIEAIEDPSRNVRLVYQNVDVSCSRVTAPKPRTDKGAGTERECESSLFEYYGVSAPQKVRAVHGGKSVYFVMVDDRGAVEISRPVIEDGKFTKFITRVFVSDGSDITKEKDLPVVSLSEPVDDFEVTVRRRSK